MSQLNRGVPWAPIPYARSARSLAFLLASRGHSQDEIYTWLSNRQAGQDWQVGPATMNPQQLGNLASYAVERRQVWGDFFAHAPDHRMPRSGHARNPIPEGTAYRYVVNVTLTGPDGAEYIRPVVITSAGNLSVGQLRQLAHDMANATYNRTPGSPVVGRPGGLVVTDYELVVAERRT